MALKELKEKLSRIQVGLKAPKDLYNEFGKYKYRNAESIFEAVKPFLEKERCCLIMADSIENIGGKNYVKATATLYDSDEEAQISASAYAREADSKKGMDDSQVTGATSSYARKYALNGLFLLDDTKDTDTNEYAIEQHTRQSGQKAERYITKEEQEQFIEESKRTGMNLEKYLLRKVPLSVFELAMEKMKDIQSIPEQAPAEMNQEIPESVENELPWK